MPRKTAVAAPASEPFEDLFEVIDRMTFLDLIRFRLRLMYRLLGRIVDA